MPQKFTSWTFSYPIDWSLTMIGGAYVAESGNRRIDAVDRAGAGEMTGGRRAGRTRNRGQSESAPMESRTGDGSRTSSAGRKPSGWRGMSKGEMLALLD